MHDQQHKRFLQRLDRDHMAAGLNAEEVTQDQDQPQDQQETATEEDTQQNEQDDEQPIAI